MSSRGIRNNNPLNLRKSSDRFLGEVLVSSDKAFKQFTTMPYGYRAAFVVLGTYLDKGINTIDGIISRWAPPSENNTQQYISSVEMRSGVNRYKRLSYHSGQDYIKIVAAMCFSENGIPASMPDVIAGFNMQSKIRRM